ncbi:MAG: 50S ribosomal protein L22 [Deltaproteobacteria bacterium]|nr:50S ribosomal protein L22 [Deltaproteobacteria bacterium]MBW2051727.1 50S ribosomal protein L22 [Deltaproteobacteria bacterium]MBW2140266.1 50S ribosomal protein L22 [Deltaproteobacteria bacterium]MBW2322109.1 50S ribosomal protein L22 [Deltaproteobacteria bacterium]
MEARAVIKYVRIAPRKMRIVAENIKGHSVEKAITQLNFTPKKAARILLKALNSALANAEQNSQIDVDTLYVKRVYIDEGPMAKRWRPRAMGRATRILKRTSHVTIILDET